MLPAIAYLRLNLTAMRVRFMLGTHANKTQLLSFQVGPLEDSLEVDGVQVYPPTFAIASQPFSVAQFMPKDDESLRLRVTGSTFRFNSAKTVSEAGIELLPMTLQITSVESTPVNASSITINLLKDPFGRLTIASFDTEQTAEATPVDQDKDCKQWPLLCKWKEIMAGRIENLKHMAKGRPGCHKRPHDMQRPHSHHNPMEEETFEGKPPHRFRPGGHHRPPHHMEHNSHHGHHGHHGHLHRMHMSIRRLFFTVLVPILIGLFVGILSYLIGMALGCLVVLVFHKLAGQRYQPIALEQEDVEEGIVEQRGEKQDYVELPAYEAPPVYQDASEEEVVEETK